MALALATTPLAHIALAPPPISGSQSSLLLLPRRASPAPVSLSIPLRSRFIAAVATKEPELGGGGSGASDGAGGGGGGSGSDPRGGGQEGEGDGEAEKMGQGLSMSQKLTLAYAALVGEISSLAVPAKVAKEEEEELIVVPLDSVAGGVMGYMKSGSQKSLAAGGISALVLYFVHTQLPVRPVLASSIGLGISAALLSVMGSRFKKSGKIFPAGVVSLVSLVMVGGYFHGILRSSHA